MKTIRDFDLNNKRVIIRCDFNVPMKDGKIVDNTRIVAALPTIEYARSHNAKIILLSHLGRVKTEEDLKKNNLEPVSKELSRLLGQDILFSEKTRGEELEELAKSLQPKDILLIQNTRYEDLNGKLESSCDETLSKYWASLGDIFINDAFATLHRAHASNVGISRILPSGIGLLVEKELNALKVLDSPDHPFVVILGGAKVSDKIGVIENLVHKADKILIGGGMAFTFLKALGKNVGSSIVDNDNIDFCKKILKDYQEKIILPVDVVAGTNLDSSEYQVKLVDEIKTSDAGYDIGPKTIKKFEEELDSAKIVFWNGPLGVYEVSSYKKGTDELLTYIVDKNIKTILGGGDIVACATSLNVKDKLYHVSTGGGATLEYIEGKELPGLSAIK